VRFRIWTLSALLLLLLVDARLQRGESKRTTTQPAGAILRRPHAMTSSSSAPRLPSGANVQRG
jgi:hypothetical protein